MDKPDGSLEEQTREAFHYQDKFNQDMATRLAAQETYSAYLFAAALQRKAPTTEGLMEFATRHPPLKAEHLDLLFQKMREDCAFFESILHVPLR